MSPDDAAAAPLRPEREVVRDYLECARSWELDRAARSTRSARLAWGVAAFAGLVALAEAVALAGLAPLKEVQTAIVRVDSSSGATDTVPIYTGTTDPGELVTRALLNGFVVARERFFHGTAEADYELVAAQQGAALNQAWAAAWDRAQPASPLNVYRDGTTVRAQVRSITFLKLGSGKTVAQVRFTRLSRAGGIGDEQPTHWVATIDYAYGKPSQDARLRALNPLGFKVLEYQREPEVVPPGREAARGP